MLVGPDPTAKRGKVVQLTQLGLQAQEIYFELTRKIEEEWGNRFGKTKIGKMRSALETLFEVAGEGGRAMSAGLIPPPGVMRAGAPTASLGQQTVGATALQRMKDMVAQTEEFVRDPAGSLPHFPLWDMNRGFGP